jgi:methyl coenzyme M reductase beta subunit
MDQLLKDKDDANRQLKMMQEGKELLIIHPSQRIIICVIAPCQGIKSGTNIWEEHGYHFFLFQNVICALEVIV